MHELAICQSMIAQVEEIAASHAARRVVCVNVRIGALSGVASELLENAFPFACAGTVAEGAKLAIENVPVRVSCTRCGMESDADSNRLVCSGCGDFATRLISGDELLLTRVELETENHPSCGN